MTETLIGHETGWPCCRSLYVMYAYEMACMVYWLFILYSTQMNAVIRLHCEIDNKKKTDEELKNNVLPQDQ